MTIRRHSDLRQLALAYYRGWISREKYVGMRSTYLGAITKGRNPPAINPKDLEPQKPVVNATEEDPGQKNRLFLPVAVGLVVTAVIVTSVIMVNGSKKQVDVKPEAAIAQPVAKPTDTPETRFNSFIDATFLQKQDWSADTLNVLKFKWQSLSEEQQTSIRSGNEFQAFTGRLTQMILAEREKSSMIPTDRELTLLTTARHMGLLDSIPQN